MIPPSVLTHIFASGPLLLLVISTIGLLWGLRNSNSRSRAHPSLWICVGSGALSVLTEDALQWTCCALSLLGGVYYSFLSGTGTAVRQEEQRLSRRATIMLGALGIVAIVLTLLDNLSRNLQLPLVWEATVILSFIPELNPLSIVDALGNRLLWSEGLLSEGDQSLLFGFPTAILLSFASSLFSLRIVSVIAFAASTLLLVLTCQRFMNPIIGLVILFAFGLNEVGLLFGRYGSSIAATIFSVIAALFCCARCVSRPTVYRVLIAFGALYLATLGYAPGRLVVLLLLVATTLGIAINHTITIRNRFAVTGILCALVGLMVLIQNHFGRVDSFLSAREEQFFMLFKSGFWPDEMLPEWEAFVNEGRDPQISDYVRLGSSLILKTTGPQLLELVSPFHKANTLARRFHADPLHQELYAPCLFPFLILGVFLSRKKCSAWFFWVLLGWVAVATVPVLLTNRADAYRTCMLLVPIGMYIAIGLSETWVEARRTGVPAGLAGALICCVVVNTASTRMSTLSKEGVSPTLTERVITELEPLLINHAVVAAEELNFRGRAQAEILLLQRQQRGLAIPAEVLHEEEYKELELAAFTYLDKGEDVLEKLRTALDSGAAVILEDALLTSKIRARIGGKKITATYSAIFGNEVVILKKL
jgi:hypothetical protein